MPITRLTQARKRTVGSKQTLRAVERGQAKEVYIAQNAERHVVEPIVQACTHKGVTVVIVDNMQSLGRACGIEVTCAAAAVIED